VTLCVYLAETLHVYSTRLRGTRVRALKVERLAEPSAMQRWMTLQFLCAGASSWSCVLRDLRCSDATYDRPLWLLLVIYVYRSTGTSVYVSVTLTRTWDPKPRTNIWSTQTVPSLCPVFLSVSARYPLFITDGTRCAAFHCKWPVGLFVINKWLIPRTAFPQLCMSSMGKICHAASHVAPPEKLLIIKQSSS